MRHFLFFTVLSLGLASSLVAQQRDTIRVQKNGQHNGQQMRPLKNLDLSADQKTQLKAINQQSKASADSLKNIAEIDPGMRRELQKQLVANRRKLIMETLTPDQQKQYNEALKANRKKMHKHKKISPDAKDQG